MGLEEEIMKKLLSIMLLGGALALSGCGNDNEFVITGNSNPGIAAPVCQDDAYTTNANTALTVPAATGVLANDTPNGATLTFQATSVNGGTITGAQDGSFTYTPAANFFGSDSFTYTLGNSGGVVTCKVTITVVAVNGFFVDAATGSDTTGSFTNGLPFATVQAAVAAAGTNQDIVVRPGSYTGTVTLKNGQRLLGSGSVLAQGVVRPTLSGPIVLADGNTLDFLRIANSPDDGVNGDGQAGGTITNCEIDTVGTNMQGVSAIGVTGNWTVSQNTIANTSGVGATITTNSNSLTLRFEDNQITNAQGAVVFVSEGTSTANVLFRGNTFTNSKGIGNAFELTCGGTANCCLDLQSNANDDTYSLSELNLGPAVLSVEQLSTLTDARPAGAGNSGTVIVDAGVLNGVPAEVADGACGF